MPRLLATLTAYGITKSYGDASVLDRVSASVGPGSKIGVVGRNGAGKSTLLRLLAGLEEPDAGQVIRSPSEATVAYLPQEPDRPPGETLLSYLARRTGVAAAEARVGRAATRMASGEPGAGHDYASALDHYVALGGPDLRHRAEAACADLGLSTGSLDEPTAALSGGQAARAALAGIFLARFDVFLLDEPTNDLDFDGLEYLERFVSELRGGLAVVSHDRAFLERTITSVLELDEATHAATAYAGGWAAYLELREVARRHAEDEHEAYQARRGQLLERARRQRQWAAQGRRRERRRPRDTDKSARDWRINRTEKEAAKVRVTERALARMDAEAVPKPHEPWKLRLRFTPERRSGDVVVRLDSAVIERGGFRLGPADVEVHWAERVAIVGRNGAGKTTLLQTLLGHLPLEHGQRWMGPSVVAGELDQARAYFSDERSLLELFTTATRLSQREARGLLATFGLGASHVRRVSSSLSPGERTRAALAALMAEGVNLLVLDEPTNHLDLPGIEELESALEGYDGTLLLVTHDRRLLDAVHVARILRVESGAIVDDAPSPGAAVP